MTGTYDDQVDELIADAGRLRELTLLLKWLEPRTRAALSSDWHVVSAALWVAGEHARDVERRLRDVDDKRRELARLDVEHD